MLGTDGGVVRERYDADGNLTSKTVGRPGNHRSGSHSFDYEHQGRLEVWSGPGGTVSYSWDDRGNRETAGSDVYTYDERNRMLSGPDGTYPYTPRGTLTSVGGSSNGFDPFGRLTEFSDGATSVVYSYDGLDRVATRDGTVFTFAGAERDPAPRLVGWDRISSVELARRGDRGQSC